MNSIIKRNRILQNEEDVFSQNAWDDTEWTDEMCKEAEGRIELQRASSERPQDEQISLLELEVDQKWDAFYRAHGDKFFKDRKWIFSEYPELLDFLTPESEPCKILEVGCGVGNALVHIVNSNRNPKLHLYCCDLSPSAIDTLKGREFYQKDASLVTAFVADVCKDFDEIISKTIPSDSLKFITLIFTLSALKPELMKSVIKNLASLLQPGGMILFRDYARYDLTQLRFKGKSFLKDNYYVRSDGTTSYFFTKDFVDDLFKDVGLTQIELKSDNRMLVNRQRGLKMCRCWIQAKYQRPL